MDNKLTPDLAARLEQADDAEIVDVVLELYSPVDDVAETQALSRSDKINARKEAFSRDAAPVEEAITQLGGEVTGRAWINQTVRARVPAQSVGSLSQLDTITAVDSPRSLDSDVS